MNGARAAVIDGATPGYPRENLSQMPAGDYHVQAVLNIYGTFRCSDGAPQKCRWTPRHTSLVRIESKLLSAFWGCVCTGLNSQSA
jgi:hypothetical protein